MTKLDDAIDRVSRNIAQTGALTKEASRRYEQMFADFRVELDRTLDASETLADAAQATMAMLEQASNLLRDSFPNPQPRACRDQCSACCHLFVSVPPGVTELIASHIKATFTAAQTNALLDRLRVAANEIEQFTKTNEVRARCPLLDEQDRCSIYDMRPLTCRAFTSADAGLCHAMVFGDSAQQTARIDQDPGHYRLHIEATEALQNLATRRGLEGRQKGFVHALLDRLDNGLENGPASA
ncbi:YkgJ family cysteine cluster protein [Thalassospira sp. HF15]|uniref:YkgJ family cysteine cluster protein n=1 Tax=Thalassospira sp. HF15 TaxID=2722755 RepID=UPI0014305137|nr:YkgJ family cysteine cluster protein [Thalassospira sp. HF15]NIY76028.1 YkgJ family cysteine cluster protein [Thalassospira sp. HF15]